MSGWMSRISRSAIQSSKEFNAGLEGATFLVLCLSGHGLSPWVNREWMSTLDRQLSGAGVKILPAKLVGGKLPAILADIRAADLTRSWDDGVRQLKAALA